MMTGIEVNIGVNSQPSQNTVEIHFSLDDMIILDPHHPCVEQHPDLYDLFEEN